MYTNIRTACAVVLYHPENDCIDRIIKYSSSFEFVYIFDNTEGCSLQVLDSLAGIKNASYCSYGKNIGLPKAYNYFLSMASGRYDYLCLLDQDSEFEPEQIEKMISHIRVSDTSSAAVIAPEIMINGSPMYGADSVTKAAFAINSGSFLNLSLICEYSLLYDENYFIDRVDADFCTAAVRKGLDILIFCDCILYQQLGTRVSRNHSGHAPIRHFYIFRDRLYYNKKYFSPAKAFIMSTLQSFRHLAYIILYENEKIKKLSMCIRAFAGYRRMSH